MSLFRKKPDDKQDEALAAYYAGAATWESTIARRNAASRALAWTVAAFSSLLAAGAIAALVMALPLKQYEPYVVEVDRDTGFIEVKRALQPGALRENEAVTMSNIVRYIRARETYDPKSLVDDFKLAQILSTGEASKGLTQLYTPGNPENPVDVLGRSATISVNIKALSFPNKTTALVRFSTIITKPTLVVTQHWQALVRFRYTSSPLTNELRFDNPLGFQVTEYRRDQETVRADSRATPENSIVIEPPVMTPEGRESNLPPVQSSAESPAPNSRPPVIPAPIAPPAGELIQNPPPPPLPGGSG